jgi:hypothetical protein
MFDCSSLTYILNKMYSLKQQDADEIIKRCDEYIEEAAKIFKKNEVN